MTFQQLEKVPVGTMLRFAWSSGNNYVDLRVRFEGVNTQRETVVVITEVKSQSNYFYLAGQQLNISEDQLPYLSPLKGVR